MNDNDNAPPPPAVRYVPIVGFVRDEIVTLTRPLREVAPPAPALRLVDRG